MFQTISTTRLDGEKWEKREATFARFCTILMNNLHSSHTVNDIQNTLFL